MPPKRQLRPRGALQVTGGFHPKTWELMNSCVLAFDLWLRDNFSHPLAVWASSGSLLAQAARAYGRYLFEHGHPRYLFVYTLTGIQEKYRHWRPMLGPAWRIDEQWQREEPGHCRLVLPGALVRAMAAVAVCWGWFRWLGVTLMGFTGFLHPKEFLLCTRQLLVLPRDFLMSHHSAYVHIPDPKTARYARRQHARIDDPQVVCLLDAIFGNLPSDELLYPTGAQAYRRRWNLILEALEVPHSTTQSGVTPGCLRGSGATFAYLMSENLPLICWRGRWAKSRTTEHYLQEVAAQVLFQSLPDSAKQKIKGFSEWADHLLQMAILVGQSQNR